MSATITIDFTQLEQMHANLSSPTMFWKLQQAIVQALHYTRQVYLEEAKNWQSNFNAPFPFGWQNMGKKYFAAVADASVIYPYGSYFSGLLQVDPDIVKHVEEYVAPFDMKPGLLTGPNAKTSDTGSRYNIVPFRHALSKTTPSVAEQMQSLKPSITKMRGGDRPHPKEIERIAKYPESAPTKMTRAMLKMAGYPSVITEPGAVKAATRHYETVRVPISKEYHIDRQDVGGYIWKSGLWEGMIHQIKWYKSAMNHKFTTFRRVSDKSDPNSWIHPGHPAYPLNEIVAEKAQTEVANIISGAFSI